MTDENLPEGKMLPKQKVEKYVIHHIVPDSYL